MNGSDVLTRDLAEKRASLISNVGYVLKVVLKKNSKTYSGICDISFSLGEKDEILIDFIGNMKSVLVNGSKAKYRKEECKIFFSEGLVAGENKISIEYENAYDKTGSGLHHFIDPEDGNEYLYSNFEPYNAHRMFPCFDQPDLKATYYLTVSGPKEWSFISNTPEEKTTGGDIKTVTFRKTKPFSTYLFHLSAGTYEVFEDKYKEIPLRIFCRKPLKKYAREKEMFLITKQGLDFYSKFFDFPYPFEKYDQIFCPEFNHGAMENVGAVTFTESLIYRYTPTRTERSRLADVVLHEMVHMWFGDLVTMKWWDDLWLNESFADYLSYLGMVRATEFKDGWQDFYARKAWAYYQDQLVTTHPIAADAKDTDIAFSNFDGISYSKGAAVLKQLMFFIGEEPFKKGLQNYFKKHQWKNTELKDFFAALEGASGKSLSGWSKKWIETTGVSSIEPKYTIKEGRISSFKLTQKSENSILRPRKTRVGFVYENVTKAIDVEFGSAEATVKEAVGMERPLFVHTNSEDYDYVKDVFDGESMEYVLKNTSKIKDNLTRQMVYGSLWQMVRDAKLNPKKYLDMVYDNVLQESDLKIIESLLMRTVKIMAAYVPDSEFNQQCKRFLGLGWSGLEKAEKGKKNAWFDFILPVSAGSSTERLVDLIEGKVIEDFEFNQEQRWAVISVLSATGHQGYEKLLANEGKMDPSDKGSKSAFKAEVSNLKNKKNYWDIFVSGNKYSLDYLRKGMQGFYWRFQKSSMENFPDLFFKEIESVFATKDRQYGEAFFDFLFPSMYANEATVKAGEALLEKDLHQLLRKNLLESLDEMKRTIKILKAFSK